MPDAATIPRKAPVDEKRRHRRQAPRPPAPAASIPRVLLDAAEAAQACGLSRSFFLGLVNSGRAPRGVKLGRRRLWPVAALQAWAAGGCRPRAEDLGERKDPGR